MLFVVLLLLLATSLGFANRLRHRRRDFIAIQNRFTVNVTRRAPYGLNQGALGAQEALFIGVQNRHQRDFRHIQPFAQQVNPHQNVKLAQTQIADDFHALHGINI